MSTGNKPGRNTLAMRASVRFVERVILRLYCNNLLTLREIGAQWDLTKSGTMYAVYRAKRRVHQ